MSSALKHYEQVILHNSTKVSSIESSLRSLTWFLPGRFQDSELASETLYSLLNILGVYHDSVLHRTVATIPSPFRPPPSSHARYTRHWMTTSPAYSRLARLLTLLNYTALLAEMTVNKRLGRREADTAVLAIESLRAALRLALLHTTRGRALVQPAIPEREVDPSVLDLHRPRLVEEEGRPRVTFEAPPTVHRSAADVLLPAPSGVDASRSTSVAVVETTLQYDGYWKGSKTGRCVPTIATLRSESPSGLGGAAGGKAGQDAIKQFLANRVLTVEDVKRPQDLVARLTGLARLAEVVWILRPLIYVFAMRKYGRKHTLPFLLSVSLEYLAFSLRQSVQLAKVKTHKASHGGTGAAVLSEVEKAEMVRRGRAFWWYALRGPAWEFWTKPRLENIISRVESKPLLGYAATIMRDYLPLVDGYYFYTS